MIENTKAFGVPRLVAAKVAGGKVGTSRKKFTEVFFFSSDERRGHPRGHPAEDITARHFGRRQARCRRSPLNRPPLVYRPRLGQWSPLQLATRREFHNPQAHGNASRASGTPCSQNFVNSQFFRGEVLNSSDIRAVNVARE